MLLSFLAQAAQGGGGPTAKDVREWLGLGLAATVLTPAAIWWFTNQTSKRNRSIEREQQQDAVVAEYISAMKDLMIEHSLSENEPTKGTAVIARTMTLTALSRLRTKEGEHSRRKLQILQFLREAGLIPAIRPKVFLGEANLRGAKLSGADLSGADLGRADLTGADLGWASLTDASLQGANLGRAFLGRAKLNEARLSKINLTEADLTEADLRGADLRWAFLTEADLTGADLTGADLRRADLDNVRWDENTQWPKNPDAFKRANNIPPVLKEQLGL